ncbi:MAG: type II toxin-antitoxin system RelE/ParE family toxin [Chloroflexota bacterium]
MEVRWTTPALDALSALQDYLAQDSPAAADLVTKRITDSVDDLTSHPLIGRPGRVAGTRELVIPRTAHIAAYRVRGAVIQVVAIIYQAQQWPERFE